VDRLEPRSSSGLDESGRRWSLRGAPVGAVLEAMPSGNGAARRRSVLQPAPDAVVPACPAFGQCGGCQLQEMPLPAQRQAKQEMLLRLFAEAGQGLEGVELLPLLGGPSAYGYRNKLELTWSRQAWSEAGRIEEEGDHLGLHPPGWFSKVVPLSGCPLGPAPMNEVLSALSALRLGPAWDGRSHRGAWRHAVLRDLGPPAERRISLSLVTSSEVGPAEMEAVAQALRPLPSLHSLLWLVNDGLAEVAQGELRSVLLGEADLVLALGHLELRLPHDAFFQVNVEGACLLFDRIGELLERDGALVDLYCGSGAVGLYLANRHEEIVGIELHEGAIECARQNAARNGVSGRWMAGPVEELLPTLELPSPRKLVVDPPRAGLHPAAARFLAGVEADVLVYVACHPPSLVRDRALLEAGGWRMTQLGAVDLFPQTPHLEAVAAFRR
jgi:23S rRNA (uracil-5-)-methyltransferase RumA